MVTGKSIRQSHSIRLQEHGKKLLIVEMVETQNMIRGRDVGAWSMKLNRDCQRLGISVHLLVLGVHPMLWMMIHQIMVQAKRKLLVTVQEKGIVEGLLLSISASMDIPFLGELNHQTRTLTGRPKAAGNKAEGPAETSKNILKQPRSAHLEAQVYISRSRETWD